jgi:hypothetical protein
MHIRKTTFPIINFDPQSQYSINQNRFIKTNKIDVKGDYYLYDYSKKVILMLLGTLIRIKILTRYFPNIG